MLIEHDVEAELVGQQPFVVVAVIEIGRDLRLAFAVRQVDAQRAAGIVPGVRIGCSLKWYTRISLFRHEGEDAPGEFVGLLEMGKWPARSIGCQRAPGMAAQ